MNYYQVGYLVVLTGRLSTDLEVKTTSSNKKYVKINLAVNAGQVKQGDNWVNQTDWYNLIVWDASGNASVFIDAIENPKSEKLGYFKGNLVTFTGMISKKLVMYNNKPLCEYTVHDFFSLHKIYTGEDRKQNTTNSYSSSNNVQYPNDDF